jgi:RNA polymerase sigma-70 factor, ECF subfamily
MPAPPSYDISPAVAEHYETIYRFAYSLAGNPADAADITQQTFLALARYGQTIREESKLRGWLFTTAHREFLRQRRRTKAHPTMSLDDLDEEPVATESTSTTQVDAAHVMKLVSGLDESLRAPLALFYIKNMKYREIAEILSLPIGTVMSRLARAKATLRTQLGLGDQTSIQKPNLPAAV